MLLFRTKLGYFLHARNSWIFFSRAPEIMILWISGWRLNRVEGIIWIAWPSLGCWGPDPCSWGTCCTIWRSQERRVPCLRRRSCRRSLPSQNRNIPDWSFLRACTASRRHSSKLGADQHSTLRSSSTTNNRTIHTGTFSIRYLVLFNYI